MPSGRLCTIARTETGARAADIDILTTLPRRQPLRHPLSGLLVLLALISVLAVAGPAAAAPACARQVIDDWYDDGRVDGTYPLHCYDDAIEILPRDVEVYSSAKEDIQRALQAAMRNEDPPAATTDPSPDDEPAATPPGDDPPTTTPEATPPTDGDPEVAPPVDTDDSASSLPVPLLILAALALLLVAGGSAGYFMRRIQARRLPPPTA
jgi:hypothetical protein